MNGPALLDAVLSRSTGKDSPVHGNAHWAGVAVAGLTLSEMVEERKRGWLARWGLLEGYDKTKAEQKARDAAARPWR